MNWIRNFLQENQVASGGLVLVVLGAALAYCRTVPAVLWRWLKARFILTIEVPDRDEAFNWVSAWLAAQPYVGRARRLTVDTTSYNVTGSAVPQTVASLAMSEKPVIRFVPSPGLHLLRHNGVWLLFSRIRTEASDGGHMRYRETFEIRALTRHRDQVLALLETARDALIPVKPGLEVYWPKWEEWILSGRAAVRPADSVVLADNLVQVVRADVLQFLSSRTWYESTGVPYRRGYLFHGVPGNGKTSLAMLLASELRMRICTINLASYQLTDDRLIYLLTHTPARSLILFEDIDCAGITREIDGEQRGITMSGLLNALDGVGSAAGQIVIMTTNHIEKLDPALVRPGRCDAVYEFGNADKEQARQMFRRFFPSANGEADAFACRAGGRSVSMAAIQEHLLRNRDDVAAAAEFCAEYGCAEPQNATTGANDENRALDG